MHIRCLNCKSNSIITDIRVVDRGEDNHKKDLKLEIYEKPNALIFKGTRDASLKADVCKDCGHVMFYIPLDNAIEFSKHKT